MTEKNLDYYMSLPYEVETISEPVDNIASGNDSSGYVCTIPILKGCIAFGETIDEALKTINEVKQIWLEIALENGWKIPEPTEG